LQLLATVGIVSDVDDSQVTVGAVRTIAIDNSTPTKIAASGHFIGTIILPTSAFIDQSAAEGATGTGQVILAFR
jgi:hypothetical protein